MADELICGFCSENLDTLTLPQREDHYEAHFLASSNANPSPRTGKALGQKYKKKFHPNPREPWKMLVKKIENDVFWYSSLSILPPPHFTPGLIPILRRSLTALCTEGKVTRAVLCHEKVVHISKELWDASWGCGYLNFLMLCTGLLEQQAQPLYFPLLDTYPPPSVRSLQSWIQRAWDDGYDQIGRTQLHNKIIGTSKWIGTAEIYIAFSHRGIPAELLDFNGFRDKESCAAAVIRWMVNYFASEKPKVDEGPSTSINNVLGKTSPILVSRLMPVILQHRGHSRLIIGYQRNADGNIDLLTFDTGRLLPRALKSLARAPYGPISQDDARSESDEPTTSMTEQTLHDEPRVTRRPITLMDLLTPSEKELARGHMLNTDKLPKRRSTKSKIMSHLKFGKRRDKGKSPLSDFSTNLGRKTEPDPRQVQKAFKLTHQQLALNAEYQILYVPLRAPLTEEEKLSRKVVKCERATSESLSSMKLQSRLQQS